MGGQLNLLLTLRIDLFTLEEVYPDSEMILELLNLIKF